MRTNSKQDHLAAVLAALDRGRQRATYAAVGGVVGLPAQSVMQGQPKTAMNSWVVSKDKQVPTGYAASEYHPHLTASAKVIETAQELRAWLVTHS
jgi:hypothetical protein